VLLDEREKLEPDEELVEMPKAWLLERLSSSSSPKNQSSDSRQVRPVVPVVEEPLPLLWLLPWLSPSLVEWLDSHTVS